MLVKCVQTRALMHCRWEYKLIRALWEKVIIKLSMYLVGLLIDLHPCPLLEDGD